MYDDLPWALRPWGQLKGLWDLIQTDDPADAREGVEFAFADDVKSATFRDGVMVIHEVHIGGTDGRRAGAQEDFDLIWDGVDSFANFEAAFS